MAGYIKTWHMINFGIPEEDHVHVCMPKIRLKFPFLLKDTLLGRAKRAHRDRKPLLVNSFKAHFKAVTDLLYIDMNEMIIRYLLTKLNIEYLYKIKQACTS